MAAGLGYKEFSTGDVLTAADANGYLASQVVMVFASAAARTSAIASPQEGMISYLKDTNSTEYYSGSAWVALGGSSGSIALVKTVTFSGASTVDLSDSFSSTYNHYLLNGSITSSADGDLLYRWRVSGSDDSSSNYHYQIADISGATGTNIRLTGQTSGRLCATRASSARESFKAELYNPFLAATKNWVGDTAVFADSSIYINQISGSFSSATSFTGMTVYPSSGTITGSLFIYGYKNS
jgi:hypothetical protein